MEVLSCSFQIAAMQASLATAFYIYSAILPWSSVCETLAANYTTVSGIFQVVRLTIDISMCYRVSSLDLVLTIVKSQQSIASSIPGNVPLA